jgi:hypothetical protein
VPSAAASARLGGVSGDGAAPEVASARGEPPAGGVDAPVLASSSAVGRQENVSSAEGRGASGAGAGTAVTTRAAAAGAGLLLATAASAAAAPPPNTSGASGAAVLACAGRPNSSGVPSPKVNAAPPKGFVAGAGALLLLGDHANGALDGAPGSAAAAPVAGAMPLPAGAAAAAAPGAAPAAPAALLPGAAAPPAPKLRLARGSGLVRGPQLLLRATLYDTRAASQRAAPRGTYAGAPEVMLQPCGWPARYDDAAEAAGNRPRFKRKRARVSAPCAAPGVPRPSSTAHPTSQPACVHLRALRHAHVRASVGKVGHAQRCEWRAMSRCSARSASTRLYCGHAILAESCATSATQRARAARTVRQGRWGVCTARGSPFPSFPRAGKDMRGALQCDTCIRWLGRGWCAVRSFVTVHGVWRSAQRQLTSCSAGAPAPCAEGAQALRAAHPASRPARSARTSASISAVSAAPIAEIPAASSSRNASARSSTPAGCRRAAR